MRRVADRIAGRVQSAISQPTEWQYIRDQINAAFVFARAGLHVTTL